MKRKAKDSQPSYFGVALRHHLHTSHRGLQREIAAKAGLSVAQLQRIASGASNGSVAARNAIAQELGTTHEDMLILGRNLLAEGQPPPRKAPPARRGVYLSAELAQLWPDLERYGEMLNLAAGSSDKELILQILESALKQAMIALRAAREREKAKNGILSDDNHRSDVKDSSRGLSE